MNVIDLRTRQELTERTFAYVSTVALDRYRTGGVGAAWPIFKAAMSELSEKVRSLNVAAIKDYNEYMWLCAQLLDYVVEPNVFREFQQQVGGDMEALSKYVKERSDVSEGETERFAVFRLSSRSLFQSLAKRYPGTP